MTASHAAASLGPFLRRHDPDRYLCTLPAPAPHRETLFALYAFNHELARACEVASQPGLALIRLHWWREVVDGTAKLHEVATPLHAALAEGRLPAAPLLAMIDARDREAEADFATMEDWRTWLHEGAGSLTVAAATALGASDAVLPAVRTLGAGIGAAGQLRNIAAFAAQGRCLLPRPLLDTHALTEAAIIAAPYGPATLPVRNALAEAAQSLLGPAERRPRAIIAACLPAILARRDAGHPQTPPHPRGLPDRIAVLRAGLTSLC